MKVLALATDAFGGAGGIATFNRAFVNALCRDERIDNVTVMTRSEPFALIHNLPGKVRQVSIPSKLLYSVTALGQGVRSPDLIWCGHVNLTPLAAVLAGCLGSRYWLQLHGIEAFEPTNRSVSWAVRQADFVTAVSRHTRSKFLSWSDLPYHRVKVLPNTFDAAFAPGPRRSDMVARFGLHGKRVVLTVARINSEDAYKGHDRVMVALRRLVDRMPDLVYLVVGDGTDRPRLTATAQRLGLGEHVKFAGQIDDAELPDCYRLADAFVMPSTAEGFGIVFIEAAATGLPVIGGDSDGSRDALADGAMGTLVSASDEDGLVDAIEAALKQKTRVSLAVRFRTDEFQRHVEALLDCVLRLAPK